MKWYKIPVFIIPLVLFPVIIFVSTYYLIGGSSINSLLNGLTTFFEQIYARDQSSFGLAGVAILVMLSQFFSGYAFNKINEKIKNEQGTHSYRECFKKCFQKNLNSILKYVANRVLIFTYAIYEFLVFYLIVLLIFGKVLENYNFKDDELSSSFLYIILTTVGIVLIIGLLNRLIKTLYLNKFSFIKKFKIEKGTSASIIVLDFQIQFCNMAFLLILPLTMISIFGNNVNEKEIILFFSITTLVMAAYCFVIIKGKLYDFLLKPVNYQ